MPCFHMRECWIRIGRSHHVYCYSDWSTAVPPEPAEFYLTHSAAQPNLSTDIFLGLLVGAVAMIAFGHAGETSSIEASTDAPIVDVNLFKVLVPIRWTGQAAALPVKASTNAPSVDVNW